MFNEDFRAGLMLCVLNNSLACGLTNAPSQICNMKFYSTHQLHLYTRRRENVQQEQSESLNQRKWPLERSSVVFSQCGAFYVINISVLDFRLDVGVKVTMFQMREYKSVKLKSV